MLFQNKIRKILIIIAIQLFSASSYGMDVDRHAFTPNEEKEFDEFFLSWINNELPENNSNWEDKIYPDEEDAAYYIEQKLTSIHYDFVDISSSSVTKGKIVVCRITIGFTAKYFQNGRMIDNTEQKQMIYFSFIDYINKSSFSNWDNSQAVVVKHLPVGREM